MPVQGAKAPPTGGEDTARHAMIDRALARGTLNDWETRFLREMHARIGRDGQNARLTQRQSRKLDQILGRSQVTNWRGRGAYRSRRSSVFYIGKRFQFRLAMLGCAMLGLALHQAYVLLSSPVVPAGPRGVEAVGPPTTPPAATASPVIATTTPVTVGVAVAGSIRVIDGDTVAVGREHFRLVGLNAPETIEPRCAVELALGNKAKQRLKQLLSSSTPHLAKVACACPPGTEGTKRCNFGRSCAVLKVNGTDVARILIGEGLAASFQCGATSCPPLPRPWCG